MIIGLTGGIGSGKSIVGKIFETLGCTVFNSDNSAREIYFDAAIKHKVVELLGEQSYLSDTKIDKNYISAKIFENTHLMTELNNIIHPAVSEGFKTFVGTNPGKIIIKESALLFEAKVTQQVNKIITVAADDEIRIKRVMTRDGTNREDVLLKMKNQMPQSEKINKSDFVIYNNEDLFLTPQVLNILKKLTNA